MSEKMKMEAQQQQSLSILTNKTLYSDIKENQCQNEDDEELAGYNCPRCGYPVVIEMGLELCYSCGWSKDEEESGYYDE